MTRMIFYPVGNSDSTLIHLSDDRLILMDYFNAISQEEEDKRVRLDEELRTYLSDHGLDYFDMVAFSHPDDDHIHGAEDFFWLDHAEKYQADDRPRITELAVPASFILEAGLEGSARIIRQEARYRLIELGSGIRVFGKPESLEEWISNQGVDPSTRRHLITTAGECVPGYSRVSGKVEIFSHSPFSFRIEGEIEDRNGNSLVWHLTFFDEEEELRCILGADAEHQTWADLVYITEKKGNHERLDWDLFRISHHCSYSALSDEKGNDETTPRPEVSSLFAKGGEGGLLIASCNPIPTEDTSQPPHKQAAAFYHRIVRENGNEDNFVVTMQWPSKDRPKPIEVETSKDGLTLIRSLSSIGGVGTVIRRPSERVG